MRQEHRNSPISLPPPPWPTSMFLCWPDCLSVHYQMKVGSRERLINWSCWFTSSLKTMLRSMSWKSKSNGVRIEESGGDSHPVQDVTLMAFGRQPVWNQGWTWVNSFFLVEVDASEQLWGHLCLLSVLTLCLWWESGMSSWLCHPCLPWGARWGLVGQTLWTVPLPDL